MANILHKHLGISRERVSVWLPRVLEQLGFGVPMTAIMLAARAGIVANRESRRRIVRDVVARLREQGHRICAEIPGGRTGYWLAREDAEWREYLEATRTGAKFRFVVARRAARAAEERIVGQGVLFA